MESEIWGAGQMFKVTEYKRTYGGGVGVKERNCKRTYEGHGVACAGHDRLHHVHEHSQGKQDGNACKKSPTIKERKMKICACEQRYIVLL